MPIYLWHSLTTRFRKVHHGYTAHRRSRKTTIYNSNQQRFLDQLEHECEALAHYAFSKGITVPGNLMRLLNSGLSEEQDVRAHQVTDIYNQLSELVAPAKPQTILLMYDENKKAPPFLFLGSVPLIRRMMV